MSGTGVCPVCTGTLRKPCPKDLRGYGRRYGWYGYDAETDTVRCNNCGGQMQGGSPTGQAPLRPDGTPCVHSYTESNVGRCLHQQHCKHCGHTFTIDSGD